MDNYFIKGECVGLRIFDSEKDAGLFARWARDSEFGRLLDSDPVYMWTEKQVKVWFEKENDLYLFMIELLETNLTIGLVELNSWDWSSGTAWVGIGLGDRDYWGRGYGTDAMRILLRYAFMELNLHRITLNVFEYNQRGIRSYEKAGFKHEGRERKWLNKDGQRWDIIFMGILRKEWEASQNNTG